MGFSKKPAFRLPSHLQHLRRPGDQGRPGDQDRPERAEGEKPRGRPQKSNQEASQAGGDRVAQVLPEVLRAALGDRLNQPLAAAAAEPVVPVEALLGALAPYHRPKSRFEQLVMRRLVGEGYLRPLGGRDKYGFSGQYAVTRKGEKLAGMRRAR